MLKQERQRIILDETRKVGSSTLQALSECLSVSEDTVRRDIKELDALGLLRAVRGGALMVSHVPHHYRDREHTDLAQKRAIARKALSLVKNDLVYFFDGGTSVLELANVLPSDLRATIITNSFPVANTIEDHPKVELVFLGGRLYKSAFTTYGNDTMTSIKRFNADIYFFGVRSITPEQLSCKNLEDAEIKRQMMNHSTEIVGLCTLDKLNSISNYRIAETSQLHTLITEEEPTTPLLEPYRNLGIETR